MVKLKDILNTRYIYDDYITRLIRVCETYSELDLADCKFTPRAEGIIRRYYGKVFFINSKDERLNTLLLHNNASVGAKLENSKKLQCDFRNVEEFKAFLSSLDKKGHYTVDTDSLDKDLKRVATLTMLTLMYPEMVIDVFNDLTDIFSFARREWLKCNKKHDAYWLVDNSALIEITVENGSVRLSDGRVIKEDAYVQMFTVMPVDFGTRMLVHDEEFRPIFLRCFKVLDEKRETQKRMLDFLERREAYE